MYKVLSFRLQQITIMDHTQSFCCVPSDLEWGDGKLTNQLPAWKMAWEMPCGMAQVMDRGMAWGMPQEWLMELLGKCHREWFRKGLGKWPEKCLGT